MRQRIVLLTVMIGIAALAQEAPHSQSNVTVAPAVLARTAAGDAVRVIVGVDATFVPEGRLDRPAAVAAQRARMRDALDAVRARARTAGIATEAPFEFIPFFPATVTRDSLEQLLALPGVRSVEEVTEAAPTTYQSVPLTNTPAAVAAGFNGGGWAVAVLDTGSDVTHMMLAGSLLSEACYSSGGQSFCPGGVSESTALGSGRNCDWAIDGCDHGTHVASIAVGAQGTSLGPGVAAGAWLIPMQVFHLDQQSGKTLTNTVDYVKGLNRVLALAGPNNANRIAAVNMSLGGGRYDTQAQCDAETASVKAAIDNLRSIGIATIVASGNEGYRGGLARPACISTAISVGATSKTAPISVTSFSNEAPFLSLLAPGQDIDAASSFGLFAVYPGTSQAAPHVAGAWAILKQAVPNASVSSVLAALRGTGTLVTDSRTGRRHPFINVNAARLALAAGTYSTPGAPTSFTAQAAGNSVSLSWGSPAAGSGGTPTGYTVVVRGGAGGPIASSVPVGAVTTISAPVPNGVYYLSVLATNANGAGNESTGVTITVPAAATAPGAPTALTATVSGSSVSFTWAAPASGGPVSSYVLLAGTTAGFASPIASVPVAGTSFSAGGVPPGQYHVRVVSQGPGGVSGTASNEVSITIGGAVPPGAPTLNAPAVNGTTVTLSWSPGGGGAASGYTLLASLAPGGDPVATVPLNGTGVSFPGVPRGTYYLRLVASNAAGASAPSNEVLLQVP